jgi:chromosome segregation protein
MYLKLLEISGFKSFARKGHLEFKTPISAIVGPNGSGKSNVAEAFRFVLGEQSLKSMRGKRGEDLIFSGSKNERSMNRASVRVVFDNITRFLNIDFDEVIIERVVHKDGVNEYFINKSKVRLKDIHELLAGANIGASGHHIISQGEADRILSVNPQARREMIEEALGLKIYQNKITESEKKLVKVEENMKSVHSLKREIAPHLKFLSKQVQKIEQSLELREKLRGLYKEYFKREDEYLKYQKKYIQDNKNPLEGELSKLETELSEAQKILEKEQSKKSDVENTELLKFKEELADVRIKKDELSRKIGQTEGMIVFEQRRISREKEDQNREDERTIKYKEVKTFIAEIESQLGVGDLQGLISKVKEVISSFVQKNSGQENKIVDIDETELNRLREEKQSLDTEMSKIFAEEKSLLEKYENKKKEIESEKETSQKAELKIFEINAKKSELKSKLNSIYALGERYEIDNDNYKNELQEAFVLAGRETTQFFDFPVNLEEVIKESRVRQEERKKDIEKIKIKLEDMGAGSGDEIMKEYKEVQERNDFLSREIEDLEKSSLSLKELIGELREKLNTEFKEGVDKVNKQFDEFFALMFGGGKAELFLVKPQKRKKADTDLELGVLENDEEDEQSQEGIEVNVALPNKKTKGLQMLSGGERSLTSIALLFAMSQIKPPPFIILDETDAALDEANSRRYGDMIANLSKYSQLILITHNRETMSRAGILYGITMGGDGVSSLLSIELDEAVKVAK